ncbi:carbohydrate ABC transporter membrane protein 1 (CUT1 family) [Mobilisporobacter senegalensis]|uniref:Maltose/maltodextrin transport system permease protein n=1 Tax=Mobilisporobacter senegalensis TaxID=1329262 RepID=A0A3N1XFA8_9FIRM|nr:sugar ABC transporter permease [Mobilisporobacter senegalensis]ROR23682.1 carbohydrate ABC transporter membrane protein 1 (CUT1 family) [Mobilisporobacter senegalensis]
MDKLKKESKTNIFKFYSKTFIEGDIFTKLSFIIMGLSNLLRGQIVKGLIYLSLEIGFIYFMVTTGVSKLIGLRTLGTQGQHMEFDESRGIDITVPGDNSMLFLLFGVSTLFIVAAFLVLWNSNVKSAIKAQQMKQAAKKLPGFIDDIQSLFDKNLHMSFLSLPVIGILLLTVLPLIFMITIAFTNYDHNHQPPGNLFTWVGLKNFDTILLSGETISKTFWPILGWTIIWAIFATILNYILGMLLAMLINRKDIKFKGLWRTLFVLSIAVPQFVSLLIMRNILADQGALNMLLKEFGLIEKSIPFFTNPTLARISVIVINLWIGIPHTLLITTGILMNIPEDLYESAKIDGAPPFIMFFKITLPYVIFVTTPYLITQFIGNINNFNVIYLLSAGGPNTNEYYQAGKTDLLVTWLYKLTVDKKDYNYASTIGILVFVISATFALSVYRKTSAYNNEEEFQ